jgi:hypothetical protein
MIAMRSKPALVERLANRRHAAVHHVRRRHDVGAGDRMRQRRPGQLVDSRVVDDLVSLDDAAVTV